MSRIRRRHGLKIKSRMLPVVAENREGGPPAFGNGNQVALKQSASGVARADLVEQGAGENIIPARAGTLGINVVQDQAMTVDNRVKRLALLDVICAIERGHVQAGQ